MPSLVVGLRLQHRTKNQQGNENAEQNPGKEHVLITNKSFFGSVASIGSFGGPHHRELVLLLGAQLRNSNLNTLARPGRRVETANYEVFCNSVFRSSACSSSTLRISSMTRRVVGSFSPIQRTISEYDSIAIRSANKSSLIISTSV
jgi:hypothetical protein